MAAKEEGAEMSASSGVAEATDNPAEVNEVVEKVEVLADAGLCSFHSLARWKHHLYHHHC